MDSTASIWSSSAGRTLRKMPRIPKLDVEEVDDGAYRVRSRQDPQRWYDVNLYSSHCNCPRYPSISFCKHLSAVQTHFPEACHVAQFCAATTPPITGADTSMGITPLLEANLNVSRQSLPHDNLHFTRIGRKILDLASQAQRTQLIHLTPALLDLEVGLDQAKAPLLKRVAVAPNQHSWPETAAVMAARPKTKRKTHTDPYSGGERSGKKAKPDTRRYVSLSGYHT